MNRRKLLSLLLSLLIHGAILALVLWFMHEKKPQISASGVKRVTLSLKDFVIPAPAAKPTPMQPPAPPTPAPRQTGQKAPAPKPSPKPIPKPAPKPEPKPKPKPVKKSTPKPKPKKPKPAPKKIPTRTKTEPTPQPKPAPKPVPKPRPIPPAKPRPSTPQSGLAGALGAPVAPAQPSRSPTTDEINRAITEKEFRALYKDEFDHYTPNQKKFIKTNLSLIQAITQRTLTRRGYPPFAAQQRIQGVNVVEFYLHPNGDISDLKVITSSGFSVLDDNSIDTIEAAYKDYPRPAEKTKIRFYIHYRIY